MEKNKSMVVQSAPKLLEADPVEPIEEEDVSSLNSEFSGAGSETMSEVELDNPVVTVDPETKKPMKQHIYFTEMIEGESFGEYSLYHNEKRFCVVSAIKPTHLLVISSLALKNMHSSYELRMQAELMTALKENEQTK